VRGFCSALDGLGFIVEIGRCGGLSTPHFSAHVIKEKDQHFSRLAVRSRFPRKLMKTLPITIQKRLPETLLLPEW
jgi:hypothetical protein